MGKQASKNNQIQKGKGRERVGFSEFVCKSLDIQPDVFVNDTLIEIRGRNKLTVRGGGKMLSYSPDEIRLLLKKGELRIEGKRLFCGSYSKGFIEIDGLINSVCFKERAQ